MKQHERMIQFFDVDIIGRTRSRGFPSRLQAPRTIDEMMHELIGLRELNKARKPVSSRSKQEYRLEDMQELEHHWVLLINVVDTQAAHPVTQRVNGEAEDRQVIPLGADRGLESSSHLIIEKARAENHKHRALVERCPALPFAKIAAFLNYLCRESARHFDARYRHPHPSGEAGKTYKIEPAFRFFAHPSDEFREELEQGRLTGIRITSRLEQVRGYDINQQPELVEAEIKMSTSADNILGAGGNLRYVARAIGYARSLDSPFVRISFTDCSGAGHTAVLESDSGNLYQAEQYVKKRKIEGFGRTLRTAFPVIHEGIRDKMLELLITNDIPVSA